MPETGDNVAAEFGISREQADLFAAQSQAKYQKAKEEGFFADEITPIEVFQGKKLPPKLVSEDEHPRPSSTVEALTKLKPLFEGGVVTAGNASGINDGAAAFDWFRSCGSKIWPKTNGKNLISCGCWY